MIAPSAINRPANIRDHPPTYPGVSPAVNPPTWCRRLACLKPSRVVRASRPPLLQGEATPASQGARTPPAVVYDRSRRLSLPRSAGVSPAPALTVV
ncbi:MAG: hypothetical protein ABFD94_02275 [Armatimonadia bacterium]